MFAGLTYSRKLMTLELLANAVGMIAALFAAGLWLYASLIKVPNNINTIVSELQRISRWNAYAAQAAVVAALCAAYNFFG